MVRRLVGSAADVTWCSETATLIDKFHHLLTSYVRVHTSGGSFDANATRAQVTGGPDGDRQWHIEWAWIEVLLHHHEQVPAERHQRVDDGFHRGCPMGRFDAHAALDRLAER